AVLPLCSLVAPCGSARSSCAPAPSASGHSRSQRQARFDVVSTGSTSDPGGSTNDPGGSRDDAGEPSRGVGSTARPLTITVMWVWQPVDQPVVPIRPTTCPRPTAWPTCVGEADKVVSITGTLLPF